MYSSRERARFADDASRAAHELERMMLTIRESLSRGEVPDPMAIGFVPGCLERLTALVSLALPAAEGDAKDG